MVELHWPNETTFLAPSGPYRGPGTHDVPDDREDEFRERGWVDPPADDGTDGDRSDVTAGESADTDVPFDPGEFTVDELRDETDGLSDEERQALAAAERDGKDRDSAVDVLEP